MLRRHQAARPVRVTREEHPAPALQARAWANPAQAAVEAAARVARAALAVRVALAVRETAEEQALPAVQAPRVKRRWAPRTSILVPEITAAFPLMVTSAPATGRASAPPAK